MKFNLSIAAVLIFTLLTGHVSAQLAQGVRQSPTAPKERLGVSGPVKIGSRSYQLVWTSHPSGNYYKQEYLPQGEDLQRFEHLFSLEALTGKFNVKDIVGAKIAELNKAKATNPMVNYQVFEKDGEVLLDFLLSQNSPDGKQVLVVERNIQRYVPITDKNGKSAMVLILLNERAYNNNVGAFLKKMKASGDESRNALAAYPLPAITISE